jgi:glutathione S-transferase
MKMPILHGANGSPFVRKVKVICAEKSIEYEQNPIIPFGVAAEYLAKSPLGKIPCWEDGDYTLPDSSCIGQYLEKLHPEPALYPSDARELGRALWYEEYADTRLVETVGPFFFERFVKKMLLKQEPDEERLGPILAERIPEVFRYLEGELADRDHLVGGRFTFADIAMSSPFVNFRLAGEDVDAGRWPVLAAWLERVFGRPAYKGVLESEQAPA